jgi:hypothetical protein
VVGGVVVVMMKLLSAALLASLAAAPQGARAGGSFTSNDPLLNKIWSVSVSTATDMVVPGPLSVDALGRPCPVDLPVVIIDGAARDRCPAVGDLAVTGKTLMVSTPADIAAVGRMVRYFASAQRGDGAIPSSPEAGGVVLFDYNAYWVEDLYNYVLYSGDVGLASSLWGNLAQLMDGWYPAQARPDGLLVSTLGTADYSYFPPRATLVAYYNAQYARALGQAARVAQWLARSDDAARWRKRAAALTTIFNQTFWDPGVGAYLDSPDAPVVHGQDGNSFAILAGLASPAQAASVLTYIGTANWRGYGNAIADGNGWDTPLMAGARPSQCVYPFMSYFEVLARYQSGLADSALELIRREWGYMVKNGPRTSMWELIGPYGGVGPGNSPSLEHGWSSGAAPALTNYVLGVQPTSPGFATFTVTPHPSDLTWAKGTIPTPRGDIAVSWRRLAGKVTLSVSAPPGAKWTNPPPTTRRKAKDRSASSSLH